MNISLRRAVSEDCGALWQVHTQSICQSARTHYTTQEIEAWAEFLTLEGYKSNISANLFIVAEQWQTIVGFAELDRAHGVVEAVYVAPACGGRGIGTRLLHALEVHAKEQGLARVEVLSSLNAVPFYTRAKFQIIGEATHPIPHISVVLRCMRMEKPLA